MLFVSLCLLTMLNILWHFLNAQVKKFTNSCILGKNKNQAREPGFYIVRNQRLEAAILAA